MSHCIYEGYGCVCTRHKSPNRACPNPNSERKGGELFPTKEEAPMQGEWVIIPRDMGTTEIRISILSSANIRKDDAKWKACEFLRVSTVCVCVCVCVL